MKVFEGNKIVRHKFLFSLLSNVNAQLRASIVPVKMDMDI